MESKWGWESGKALIDTPRTTQTTVAVITGFTTREDLWGDSTPTYDSENPVCVFVTTAGRLILSITRRLRQLSAREYGGAAASIK